MKIPEYWARETVEEKNRDGRHISLSLWRSSDQSQEDAKESVLAAARRIAQAIRLGEKLERYPYGQGPMREEILDRWSSPQGELIAVMTRNRQGCQVLNAARAMFIDLDFPPASLKESLGYLFSKLLGRSRPSPEARREADAVEKLKSFIAGHPTWSARLYRTRAGLRALVTHALFDPAAEETLNILRALDADPLYVRLCRNQECFRARLTPKPWRCDHSVNTISWPREDQRQEEKFQKWLAYYSASHSRYATCRLLGVFGGGEVHPDIRPIIEIHDRLTRCNEPLTLA